MPRPGRRSRLDLLRRAALVCLAASSLAACAPSPHDLIGRGEVEKLAALLQEQPGAIEARNELGKTPLFYAVRYERRDAAELLLEHGADINAQDNTGMTPLHTATLGRRETAEWLLARGADATIRDHFGDTPAHLAAIFGSGVITVLAQHGAPLDTPNHAGLTPLQLARKHRQQKMVAYLEKQQTN
jgi:ankyrin repeat protein